MGTERMRVEMMLITEQFGDIVARVSLIWSRACAVDSGIFLLNTHFFFPHLLQFSNAPCRAVRRSAYVQ